jgi:hypothetical protein
MKNTLRWAAIVCLAGVYLLALLAVLHPKVSAAYKAFYIRRTAAEWNQGHYSGALQDGILFGREGLPEWVDSLYGFSFREPWGRWTDDTYGSVAGLLLAQPVHGPFCVELTAKPSHAMSKSFVLRLGKQSQTVQVIPGDPAIYRIQFEGMEWANRLEFVMPKNLPPETDFDPKSGDTRRVGMLIVYLKMIPGQCAPAP